MDSEQPKKRGRPRIERTPDEVEAIKKKRNAMSNAAHQKSGWAAQKKYKLQHRKDRYEIKVTMPASNKDAFLLFLKQTNLTISDVLLGSLYEKYGIDFRKPI